MNLAAWKMDPRMKILFAIENGDFPASYISLQEGICQTMSCAKVFYIWRVGNFESMPLRGKDTPSAVQLALSLLEARGVWSVLLEKAVIPTILITYGMDNMWMLVHMYIYIYNEKSYVYELYMRKLINLICSVSRFVIILIIRQWKRRWYDPRRCIKCM